MERRNENEVVKIKPEDIIYSIEFWGIIIIPAIILARIQNNYMLSSIIFFGLIKYFGSEKVHFNKNKLSKFILRKYPYTTKLALALCLTTSVILSYYFFKAFVCSIILSICWKEYMKLFERRKSLI